MPRPFKYLFVIFGLASAFLVPAFMDVRVPLVLPLAWHKALHVLGAVLFLGNILVTGAWAAAMRRVDHPPTLRATIKMTCWADVFFTGPGFVLATSNGTVLAGVWGGVYAWSWLLVALGLLTVTGVISMVLYPLQYRMYKLADAGPPEAPMPGDLDRQMKSWAIWGIAATVLPVAIFFIMVLKPRFWGPR